MAAKRHSPNTHTHLRKAPKQRFPFPGPLVQAQFTHLKGPLGECTLVSICQSSLWTLFSHFSNTRRPLKSIHAVQRPDLWSPGLGFCLGPLRSLGSLPNLCFHGPLCGTGMKLGALSLGGDPAKFMRISVWKRGVSNTHSFFPLAPASPSLTSELLWAPWAGALGQRQVSYQSLIHTCLSRPCIYSEPPQKCTIHLTKP